MGSQPKFIFVIGCNQAGIGLENDVSRIYSYATDLPPSKMHAAQQNISIIRAGHRQSSQEAEELLEAVCQCMRQGIIGMIIAQGMGAALVENNLTDSALSQFLRAKGLSDQGIPQATSALRQQLAILSIDGSQNVSKDLSKVSINIKSVDGPCRDEGVVREKREGEKCYAETCFSKVQTKTKKKSSWLSSASASSDTESASCALGKFLLQDIVADIIVTTLLGMSSET